MEDKILFGYDLSDIKNINEELVIEIMEKVFNEDQNICRCNLCIEDIFALSLNKLTPLYVQSTFKERTKGNDLAKILDREKVKTAILEAIKTVHRNPHH